MKYLSRAAKDKPFTEALGRVIVMAMLQTESVKNFITLPMLEYYRSNAAAKTFLISPFLGVDVPEGKSVIDIKLNVYNILQRQCGKPVRIRANLKSGKATFLPLKDLIQYVRKENAD
jgi:hypothetical protein